MSYFWPGSVSAHWGPGPVNANLGPGPVNADLRPGGADTLVEMGCCGMAFISGFQGGLGSLVGYLGLALVFLWGVGRIAPAF